MPVQLGDGSVKLRRLASVAILILCSNILASRMIGPRDLLGNPVADSGSIPPSSRWQWGRRLLQEVVSIATSSADTAELDPGSNSSTSSPSLEGSMGGSVSVGNASEGNNPAAYPAKKKKIWGKRKPDPWPPRPAHAGKGTSPLLFTCPDGRKGLHVIHTRLMLNLNEERGATGTFRAGRMLLFRDFALPSIARQVAQNFLFYVSYDHAQDFPFLEACLEIIKMKLTRGASYLYLPERGFSFTIKAHHMIKFERMKELILQHNLATAEDLEAVEIYITSRIDTDDAAHIDAVGITQKEACDTLNSTLLNRLLLTYIEPKLFWMPSAGKPYGALATIPMDQDEILVRKQKRAMRFRPVMQSLSVDKSLMHCYNPINCYSHYHYQPAFIIYSRNDTDCPFEFQWAHNVRRLRPADGEIGGLYSRSPSSWYAKANKHEYKYLSFDMDAITGCGIDPGELATTNLMLGNLFKEARAASSLGSGVVRGFGGIGVLSTWGKTQVKLYEVDPDYRKAYDSLNNDTLKAYFRSHVRSRMFGKLWQFGKRIDFDSLAAEVEFNATKLAEEGRPMPDPNADDYGEGDASEW